MPPGSSIATASGEGAPIKVTVLTGFLGAGKTTLLNALLADPAVTDTGVIVNEFGEIGIDHLLVEAAASDGVIALSDGCLCCTVRGELVDTLADIAGRIASGRAAPLRRVVVETTGLADPTPILVSLIEHPALLQAYALDGVVTVVDAPGGALSHREHEEARRQTAVADRIVLTKTDIAGFAATDATLAAIRAANPRAPILNAARGEATPSVILDCGLFDPATKSPDVGRWLQAAAVPSHMHGHDDGSHAGHAHRHDAIASFSITHEAPIPWSAVEGFLDLLRQTKGERLLRMKAVIRTSEDPNRPVVLHGVRGHLHPPVRLETWPAGAAPASRLVLIGDGLGETYVRDLFAAFAGVARIDAPDRAALEANPLAVPGHSFR